MRYIPKNITKVGRYRSSGVAWVSLALVPMLPYPNFVRQSCPEIGEYDDLESSKNRRSASWHGNQHVRLRGAQIKSIAAPTRLKDHQDSGGAVGAAVVVLPVQRGSSQDFEVTLRSLAVIADETKVGEPCVARTADEKVRLSKPSKL
jgi:hypothetical protein